MILIWISSILSAVPCKSLVQVTKAEAMPCSLLHMNNNSIHRVIILTLLCYTSNYQSLHVYLINLVGMFTTKLRCPTTSCHLVSTLSVSSWAGDVAGHRGTGGPGESCLVWSSPCFTHSHVPTAWCVVP